MGDQSAHVQLAGEDEAGDFFLQCEIGGVAAEEVFFVDADGGEVRGEEAWGLAIADCRLPIGRRAFRVGEEEDLAGTAHQFEGLLQGSVGGDGEDGGVEGELRVTS